jgi:hypothetical protein
MSLSSKFKATKPHTSRIQYAGMRYTDILPALTVHYCGLPCNGNPGIKSNYICLNYYTCIAFTVGKKEVQENIEFITFS